MWKVNRRRRGGEWKRGGMGGEKVVEKVEGKGGKRESERKEEEERGKRRKGEG